MGGAVEHGGALVLWKPAGLERLLGSGDRTVGQLVVSDRDASHDAVVVGAVDLRPFTRLDPLAADQKLVIRRLDGLGSHSPCSFSSLLLALP
jgi:hypothetical protein